MDEMNLILWVAISVFSLVFALWHGSIWEEKNPGKLGFTWGYFFIYNALINNTLAVLFFVFVVPSRVNANLVLFGAIALGLSAGLAYYSISRKRWALVISTILSLNPLWMIINIFYLKNRWSEFASESAIDGRKSASEWFKSLPRKLRVTIFFIIMWMVCVLSFVLLFEPYGRNMRDDDIRHMLSVIFIPVVVGLGLFVIYRKYIR